MGFISFLQFVYDAFYRFLTPDREVPAEVRWQLNHAMGVVARRAKRVNWSTIIIRCSMIQLHVVHASTPAYPACDNVHPSHSNGS